MAKIVIEVPDEYAEVGEALKKFMEEITAATPDTRGGRAVDFAKFERAAEQSATALERETLRRLLQCLDIDAERVIIDGRAHSRVGRYEAAYATKAGPVNVERSIYREVGQRNAKTVDPVSLRAGALEGGWLPSAAEAMAFLLQQGTSREAKATADQLGRLPYSRSSFERVAHDVGAKFVSAHAVIEDALAEAYEVPAEARSISVSLDRVSVPMEEARARPAGRPRKGAARRPVERNYRMAYCGTVTLHDGEGEALHTIRYGRMPLGDAAGLCVGMAGDVFVLLRKRPRLKLQLLCDGAPEMWNLLKAQFSAEAFGDAVHELVDLCHVVEKLGKAAQAIHGDTGGTVTQGWKMRLLNRSAASREILAELQASGLERLSVGDEQPVHDAITYLNNHDGRFDYATARALGLPIGSGNVEATCKCLFNIRLKRSGSRWKETTGEHIVQLRALALSDRWRDALELTLRPLRRPVRAA